MDNQKRFKPSSKEHDLDYEKPYIDTWTTHKKLSKVLLEQDQPVLYQRDLLLPKITLGIRNTSNLRQAILILVTPLILKTCLTTTWKQRNKILNRTNDWEQHMDKNVHSLATIKVQNIPLNEHLSTLLKSVA